MKINKKIVALILHLYLINLINEHLNIPISNGSSLTKKDDFIITF